jgi:hypothetical protein
MAKKSKQKKATTGQNFNYGLSLLPCLLEAAIIKILRTRGLNAQLIVKFDDYSLINVTCSCRRGGFSFFLNLAKRSHELASKKKQPRTKTPTMSCRGNLTCSWLTLLEFYAFVDSTRRL